MYNQFLVSPEFGGAARVAVRLAEFVRRQGRDSRVWVPGEGIALAEVRRLGLPTHPYDLFSAYGKSRFRSALSNFSLGRDLRRQGGSLIHVYTPAAYGALRYAWWFAGVTRVVHLQSMETEEDLRWALRPAPELVITCNRVLKGPVERAVAGRGAGCLVAVVPNPVDTERFTPDNKRAARARVGAPPSRPLLLMLSNLSPVKGQETAIRATALLKRRGIDVLCWMAGLERGGTTTYTDKLKSLIAELGVGDRAVLLGERRDTPDLLRAADVFLQPASTEGMPLAVLEAQATKLPVVAAPVGGVPEIVANGETGFLVAQEDVAGYADVVARLLQDHALASRLAENAYARATTENDWPTFCRRVWDLYGEVFERRRAAGTTRGTPP